MNTTHIAIVLIVIAILVVAGGDGFSLPGDLFYRGERFTVNFPVVTCIVISIVVALVLKLLGGGSSR